MGLRRCAARVVAQQIAEQPFVGLGFGAGLWKWYSVSWASLTVRNGRSTLPLARAVTRVPSLPAGTWVCQAIPNASITKHAALRHRAIIEVEQLGSPLGEGGRLSGAIALNRKRKALSASSPYTQRYSM